jgi:hypothetical protein
MVGYDRARKMVEDFIVNNNVADTPGKGKKKVTS